MPKNSEMFWYDVMGELARDSKRSSELSSVLARMGTVTKDAAQGKASTEELTALQGRLIELSGHNFGLLVPYVFHKYPLDKPLDFMSRPFMFAMTSMAPNSSVTLKAGRQVGKCVTGETRLSTNRGDLPISDIFAMGLPCC